LELGDFTLYLARCRALTADAGCIPALVKSHKMTVRFQGSWGILPCDIPLGALGFLLELPNTRVVTVVSSR